MNKLKSFFEIIKNIWLLIFEIRRQRKLGKVYFYQLFEDATTPGSENYKSK